MVVLQQRDGDNPLSITEETQLIIEAGFTW